jgi:hypothetical protein
VCCGFGYGDFEGWLHTSGKEMTAADGAVFQAEHRMQMQACVTIAAACQVAPAAEAADSSSREVFAAMTEATALKAEEQKPLALSTIVISLAERGDRLASRLRPA